MSLKQAVLTLAQQQPQLRKHLLPLLRGAASEKRASWDRALLQLAAEVISAAYQGPAFPKPGTEIKALDALVTVMADALLKASQSATPTNDVVKGSQSETDSFMGEHGDGGGWSTLDEVTVTLSGPRELIFDLELELVRDLVAHEWETALHRLGFTYRPNTLTALLKDHHALWQKVWRVAIDKFLDEVDYEFSDQFYDEMNEVISDNYVEKEEDSEDHGWSRDGYGDEWWTGRATMSTHGAVTFVSADVSAGNFTAKFKITADVDLFIDILR